jgi:hypothetical protein
MGQLAGNCALTGGQIPGVIQFVFSYLGQLGGKYSEPSQVIYFYFYDREIGQLCCDQIKQLRYARVLL